MIEANADTRIFDQLRRISAEIKKEFPPAPKIVTTMKLTTASLDFSPNMIVGREKTASLKDKVFAADDVCKAARDILTEYTKHLVAGASSEVEKFMSKTVDNLLKEGLRLVNQVREALQERDRLREYVTRVVTLLEKYTRYQTDLR